MLSSDKDGKPLEKGKGMDKSIDDRYIDAASKAVSSLSPEDFRPMKGMKVPVDAEDGEGVKVLLVGKAKNGFLEDIMGAECGYEEDEEKAAPKARIKVMIMGGNEEEEE